MTLIAPPLAPSSLPIFTGCSLSRSLSRRPGCCDRCVGGVAHSIGDKAISNRGKMPLRIVTAVAERRINNQNPACSRAWNIRLVLMKGTMLFLVSAAMLTGCANPVIKTTQTAQSTTKVTPSSAGIPNSVASLGAYEFVSVQGTGQIFTYNIAGGTQALKEPPYQTPCSSPSGMVITNIAGNNIMAVVCYDTGSLLTLNIHADGSLSPLGSVGGLGTPYPGIALDGTNVFVPLFGVPLSANGGVAKVNIASPTHPVISGMATLASPSPDGYANPGYLTLAGGYIFVAAGSESYPISTSSTIQVVNETTMDLVGSPFPVAHSPQQIAVLGTAAYVTMFDAVQWSPSTSRIRRI